MAIEIKVEGELPQRFDNDAVILLGSDPDCDVCISRPGVESRHALLVHQGAHWQIYDLRSRSGLQVNGRVVRRADLVGRDEIRVGSCSVQIANGAVAAPANVFARPPQRPSPATAPTVQHEPNVRPPAQIKNFIITERIHRGSTGDFFKAHWEAKQNRPVVIKFISSQLCQDEQAMYRFCRGVSAAGEIRHPNIVRLYRAGKADNRWYLIMEYLAKRSLKDMLEQLGRRPIDCGFARRMGIDICRALEVATERGVIHRKVTPGSVLFDDASVAKLGDFVLAREEEQPSNYQLTAQGQPLGELAYLAPEQAEGSTKLDRRVDIYGLAATLYEAITGRPPCKGKDLVETFRLIRSTPPIPPRSLNATISHEFEDVILKGLSKRPSDRFANPTEFRLALESASPT